MNVLIILSGIADAKLPLPRPVSAETMQALRAGHALLSPFDEAALELGLKLRDADPSVQLTALVAANTAQDKLLQHVASFRLDAVLAYSVQQIPAWNSRALAAGLSGFVQAQIGDTLDLVLIGREFGDEDDGGVPAATAYALGWPLVSQAMHVQQAGPGLLHILRQFGTVQEVLTQPTPVVAAVTNHARNKLRHPLLKNVMTAKKMQFMLQPLPQNSAPASLTLGAMGLASAPERAEPCQMIAGDVSIQARALAALLLTSGETA
ncbi:hypothetical protein [Bordetella avium]|uniref:hypothetical protein n=1 Tax=Bordetella avium TaxID=521 RepID=UPI000E0BB1E3|nr:hypothetical protein [Bordetella avium]RIQ15243.1 hypothetical protein D0432_03735 [Bordetella avium]RIQ38646.1 hypothetical protein D0848_08510 [Bordetella avium]RIQ43186.1 hypothetical protein D0847_08490 [Bordetella avium]RIQ43879.1 hypothetical protein D0846_07450 [Bordetella avium]RIQ53206.1 hypothetical protein D0845_01875 [Bordetella avium]